MDTKLRLECPVLENERIRLEPMKQEDAPGLFAISSPDIWAFMLRKVETEEEMYQWVREAVANCHKGTALPFVVLLKESNQVAGTTRLLGIDMEQRCCELGSTWYSVPFQRSFVNSDVKKLLLTYCFEELQFIRVQLKTDERNIRSQKAIERLGAVKEGIIRNERILSNGYIRNAILYSITSGEWPTVKQGFIERESTY
ncbi:GNAT family N-acetyltransferase [Bacillus sp. 1P06AnD]|uniref:GNAT family N-acetyltransferase n=1 Tax=Bacillus sp. 1P06AnD TaxID=3132208 RepID=UPI0039A09099